MSLAFRDDGVACVGRTGVHRYTTPREAMVDGIPAIARVCLECGTIRWTPLPTKEPTP